MSRFALSCLASLLLVLAVPVQAQSPDAKFPAKPVKMLVGGDPGGGSDLLARGVAQELTRRWGSPMVVENMPGAQGGVANRYLVRQPADGYTLQIVGNGGALLGVFKKVPHDVRTAHEFIAQLSRQAYVVLVDPRLPVSNLTQFVAYARANPGKLNYGSTGEGGTAHLGTEYFKSVTGIDMVHIPYKGLGPAMLDVMSGRISFVLNNSNSAAGPMQAGKIRALAVTGAKRIASFPDLPTVAESGFPGYELETYYGVVGPAGIPANVVNFLNREIVATLQTPAIKDKLEKEGVDVMPPHSPAQWKAVFVKDYATNEKLVQTLGIKMD